jgi:hypothetical protein
MIVMPREAGLTREIIDPGTRANVCYWPKADICFCVAHGCFHG